MTSKVDGLYHTGLAVSGIRAVALQVAGYLCKGLCKHCRGEKLLWLSLLAKANCCPNRFVESRRAVVA